MDHLNLPLGEVFRPLHYGNAFRKSEHDFHTFPKEVGWRLNGQELEVTGECRITDFNQFMQSWLFFGLLTTVLQDENWSQDDFIIQASDRIKTGELKRYLEKWEEREAADLPGQTLRMIKAQLALDKACKFVLLYCTLDGQKSLKTPREIDQDLALSLMVLGETLTNAKAKIVKRVGFTIRGWHGDANEGWGTPSCVIDGMIEDGWCPRTIHMLKGQLRSHATSLLFAFKSHQGVKFHGHDHCDDNRCKVNAKDSNGGKYKTHHHSPLCPDSKNPDVKKCYLIGPEIPKLIDTIKSGCIPILEYRKSNTEDKWIVDVEKHKPYVSYATISHVWTDGYGNPEENKLWKCQLDYFDTLFKKVPEKIPSARCTRFWIDTLAIPVDNAYKIERRQAIQKIHDIYTKAKYTVVIDNGLNQMPSGGDYEQTAMKILASGWMRRLWTLQEAYLSQRLLFAFQKNEVRNLDDLEDMYPEANEVLASNIPAAARNYFYNLLGNDRKSRIHGVQTHGAEYGLLASVWRAAQWRTTGHLEHETLALATLLNLDYQEVAFKRAGYVSTAYTPEAKSQGKRDEMMSDLWALLDETCPGSIPSGIIFLPGPRLSIEGFGWAPKSWMSGQQIDYPDPLSSMLTGAKLVNGKGLEVHYPGFLLHAGNQDSILQEKGKSFHFPSDNTLLEWYQVTIAEDLASDRGTFLEGEGKFAIILCRPRTREQDEIALLVKIKREKKQRLAGNQTPITIYHVYIVCRVRIKRETGLSQLSEWKGFIHKSDEDGNKFVCGEVLDSSQRWHVDGFPTPGESHEPETDRVGELPVASRTTAIQRDRDLEPPGVQQFPPVSAAAGGVRRGTRSSLARRSTGELPRLGRPTSTTSLVSTRAAHSGTNWAATNGSTREGPGSAPRRQSTMSVGESSTRGRNSGRGRATAAAGVGSSTGTRIMTASPTPISRQGTGNLG
ncbi:hypothetical protein BJ875DRAFT_25721 [Amylocarpus encephaloides]|uniref:Heterokaryon incompatibility domain-containing protein n=1 Tax=Amylocarpus encephaloides TaxID=45428 RepID=A0A9P7YIG0_9HELO|nr:hypothetical protein BJ875DRAFT_25721 [Amylocarpus encephaloides]